MRGSRRHTVRTTEVGALKGKTEMQENNNTAVNELCVQRMYCMETVDSDGQPWMEDVGS